MSRPSFSTDIAGILKRTSSFGSPIVQSVSNALHGEEQTSGVVRHKPTGWIAPTAYSLFSRKYHLARGQTHYLHPGGSWTKEEGVVGYGAGGRFNSLNHFNELVPHSNIKDPTLRNAALIAARTKLKRADVNLGVAFAERNATARLLGDTASNIATAFRELRHGNVRRAMNALGISSNRKEPKGSNVPQKWLELQYGWKPALSDLFGACEALEREPSANWRVTAKSRRESYLEWFKTWSSYEAGYGRARAWRSNYTRLDALPSNELIGSLASLGVTNPLLIAWEVVPYSFVVDWAWPIGSWLESIDALLGYEQCFYSSSDFTRGEWIGEGRSYSDPGFGTVSNVYEERQDVVYLERVASDSVPLPTFPRIKDPRSLGHMANGLALLASAFGRKR